MLHEVLVGVLGFPGHLIQKDATTGALHLTEQSNFLSMAHSTIISRLCKLGSYYSNLNDLVREHSFPIDDQSTKVAVKSMFAHALFRGVDDVLDNYRQAVISFEQDAIHDSDITLSHLLHSLAEFEVQLPALHHLVKTIVESRLIGGPLLSLVYERETTCGIDSVQASFRHILHCCNRVLFTSLAYWTLYGQPHDPYGELFIETTAQRTSVSDDGWQEIKLRSHMRPCYLSPQIAEKILFIGRATWVLRNCVPSETAEGTEASVDSQVDTRLLQDLFNELIEKEFQVTRVEAIVERLREAVAQRLWSLLMVQCKFSETLKLVRGMFLLGRGNVFQSVVEESLELFRSTPSRNASNQINAIFAEACAAAGIDDKTAQMFSLQLPANSSSANDWQQLSLHFQPPFPVSLILDPATLAKYNLVFAFLLNVVRVKSALEQAWLPIMAFRRSKSPQDRQIAHALLLLRQRMGFVVDNLQFYLQVDVIGALFSKLEKFVEESQDFEAILSQHNAFVTSLNVIILNNKNVVYRTLTEMFAICLKFSQSITVVPLRQTHLWGRIW
eukprot:c16876_g1_i2.p1 GENE.c16876_g1_i2~~c16876_g1_i2.p1  ORF type:complete len:557 (+),score=96.77 c16876_g1_i2:35-1705(+)